MTMVWLISISVTLWVVLTLVVAYMTYLTLREIKRSSPKPKFHPGQIVVYLCDMGSRVTKYVMHIHDVLPNVEHGFVYDGYLYEGSNIDYTGEGFNVPDSIAGLQYSTTIINVPECELRMPDRGTAGYLSMKRN